MIAAIYARKSNEQNGIADEAKSVTRQVEHATRYASGKGWTVDPARVYVDDGISGALFGAGRPGLARLLLALAPRPPFDVLVTMEEERLGRESIETAYTVKQLTDAGVRLFYYLHDQERRLDSPTDKLLLSVSAYAGEMEREKARLRTHDALLRKAKSGHVTGGRVFGYANRAVLDGGRHSHVERVIEPREATIVRRIFAHTADGWGVKRIAAALNDEAAPAPLPRRRGRPRGWAPSSVREVLHRDLYRGVLVWNRTARVVRQGGRAQRERPAADVVSVTVPALAIVGDALWAAAQARMQAAAEVYRARTGGRAFGRPANGVESKYLLTGFGVCAACGGSMATLKRAHGPRGHRRQVPFYGCMTRHLRGEAICGNALEVRLADAEQAVLSAVEQNVLNVAVLETALAKAAELLQTPNGNGADAHAAALRDELAGLDAEVARLAEAIARGGDLPALVGLLQERERRRGHVRAAAAEVERKRATHRGGGGDLGPVLDAMRGHLTDWKGMLRQKTGPARQALSALLRGRLAFTPRGRDGERFYSFEGEGTITPVIAGAAGLAKGGVAPTGFEPVFRP